MRRQRIVMVLCALFALTVGVANATADKGGNPANAKRKGGNSANADKGGNPANAKRKGGNSAKALCKKGGWMKLRRSDGTPFANQGKCVSYAARGGRLISPSAADISLSYGGQTTLTVSNAGPLAASVTVAVFRACGGGYGPAAGFDLVFSPNFATYTSKQPIPAGQSLTIVVFQICETHAEVTASSQPDPDSVPNNGVTTEDDYVVIPRGP